MKAAMIIMGCILFFSGTYPVRSTENTVKRITENSEIAKIIDFPALKVVMEKAGDTTLIINFWATWCKPCVEELPAFEALNNEYKSGRVKVLLVSLDFLQDRETHLLPFLRKKNIRSEVVLLNAGNPNDWIDAVDPGWSGSLPATLILNQAKGKRSFYEKKFSDNELKTVLQQFLQ
jgi:thiol-disulfide isomerase/thioredoxin